MANRKSTFELLVLPQQFGTVLLILSLILFISPYFAGSDFGIFKVPRFPSNTDHALRILGPVVFVLVLGLFVPLWKSKGLEGKTKETVSERRYGQHSPDVPASLQQQLPSPITSLLPDRLNPRTVIRRTHHSRIEEVVVLGTRCVIKSTKKQIVDCDALQTLVGKRINASFQGTSVSIATPEKVWVEGDQRNRYRLKGSYLGVIFTCTAQALAELHALSILHRDVNPTNMLLTATGDIVLLDLSFACQIDRQRIPVENPAFSAPEQLEKRAVPQSDFYSLAATACYLANGREPAPIASGEKLQQQILNIDFGAFHRLNPEPEEMVYRLLSTAVQDRPKSYHDIRLDPGTWPIDTSLFGVLDLDRLGFMILSPSRISIGPKDLVSTELEKMIEDKSIENAQLRADVKAFLSGENPWLA